MKGIYLAFLLIGIVLLVSSVYVAPPSHEETVATLLVSHRDDWSLKFNTADGHILGFNPELCKPLVVRYLKDYGSNQTISRSFIFVVSLAVILLSIFGSARSTQLRKAAEQDAAANP